MIPGCVELYLLPGSSAEAADANSPIAFIETWYDKKRRICGAVQRRSNPVRFFFMFFFLWSDNKDTCGACIRVKGAIRRKVLAKLTN